MRAVAASREEGNAGCEMRHPDQPHRTDGQAAHDHPFWLPPARECHSHKWQDQNNGNPTRRDRHPGTHRSVSHQRLKELRQQHRASKQDKSQAQTSAHWPSRSCVLFEEAQIDNWRGVSQFPENGCDQAHNTDDREEENDNARYQTSLPVPLYPAHIAVSPGQLRSARSRCNRYSIY